MYTDSYYFDPKTPEYVMSHFFSTYALAPSAENVMSPGLFEYNATDHFPLKDSGRKRSASFPPFPTWFQCDVF